MFLRWLILVSSEATLNWVDSRSYSAVDLELIITVYKFP